MRLLPDAYRVNKETYAVVRSDRRTFMVHASFDVQQAGSILPFQAPALILAVAFHDETVEITTTMADTQSAKILTSSVAAVVEMSAAGVLDDATLRWTESQPRGTVFIVVRGGSPVNRGTLSLTYKVHSPNTVLPLGDPSPAVPGMTDITFVGAHRDFAGPPPHDAVISIPRTTMAVTFQHSTRPLHHLYEQSRHGGWANSDPTGASKARCCVQ